MEKFVYTLESFTEELKRRFPGNAFEILEFNGTNKYIKYKCLKCGRIIEKSRANHLYENRSLCQHCYSTKNSKIRDWILNFFKTNEQFELLEWSMNTMDPITMYCKNCNRSFLKKPTNLFQRENNTICPLCGNNGAPVPLQDFLQLLTEQEREDYTLVKYNSITTSATFKHKCGYVFSQKPINFLKSRGCPKCYKIRSAGELAIERFLLTHNIAYEPQKHFPELARMSYDFYLPNHNILIEYQGEQHYHPVNVFGGETAFKIQQERDLKKQQYAQQHNFQLIYIPYYHLYKISSYLEPLLGSTTSSVNVASSEAKEKTY